MTLFDQIAIAIFVGWYAGNELYRRWPDLYSQLRHRVKNVRLSLEHLGRQLGPLWWPFGNHGASAMNRSYANTFPPGEKEILHRKRKLIEMSCELLVVQPYLTDQDFYSASYLCCTGNLEEARALDLLDELDRARGRGMDRMTIHDLLDEETRTGVERSIEWSSQSIREAVTLGMVTTEEATNALSAMVQAMEPEVLDITTKGDAGRVYCLGTQPEEGYR